METTNICVQQYEILCSPFKFVPLYLCMSRIDSPTSHSAMHSFELQEAWTGHPKVDVPDSLTCHAAAILAFADYHLLEVGALLVRFVLPSTLVHLVDLIVAAFHMDQAFEAHIDLWLVLNREEVYFAL